MVEKIGAVLGLALLAGYTLLIALKILSVPLLVIVLVALALATWHAIEEEWLGRD
jgi:hypothetical protein